MAHIVLFLPGIMGSRLSLGAEEVWPPTPLETVTGYGRLDKLQSPHVKPTKIIRSVACFGFYDRILDDLEDLGFRDETGDKRLLALAYDWRRDLFETAGTIADILDEKVAADDELTIVAHSMGGLIARLLLESGAYETRAWFRKIDAFFALATPHLGAPLALARALGLDGALGISAESFKELTKNPAYPSGYQLLPAPGEDACWDVSGGERLAPLDIYDSATAWKLGLVPGLIARARAVHDAFAKGAPPSHVRYFYFAGSAHRTVSRVNVVHPGAAQPHMMKVYARGAGDGTVPLWSALPRPVQKHVVANEHATVFKGDSFRNVFFALFGRHIGPLDMEKLRGEAPVVSLSQPVYLLANAAEGIEVVIESETGISELDAQLVVESIRQVEASAAEGQPSEGATRTEPTDNYRRVTPLAYSGGALRTMALDLPMPEKPDFYQLRLQLITEEDEALDLGDPIPFTVSR